MQRLELTWIGKGQEPEVEPRILLHDPSKDYGDPNSENMLIHGDNLLALKALEQQFAGQVKCIYIDPPYNTGAAFEHYDDNLEHSIWLSLMQARLKIMHTLLSEKGSIWITLDDNEVFYCKIMMDEIFGRKNFVGSIAWEKADSPKMDPKFFSTSHDLILVYAKNINEFVINKEYSEEIPEHYNKVDESGRRYYLKPMRVMGGNVSESLYYPMIAPDGTEVYPISAKGQKTCWRWSKKKTEEESNRIEWVNGRNGWSLYFRIYADSRRGTPIRTVWHHEEAGSNRTSKSEINALFGNATFDTPKPEKLIQKVINAASDEGDLVLDSFLGSGTTAAVAQKMGRSWIGIELGEHCYTHCKPRLDKVIDGEQGGISKAVDWQGGGGYKFYELAPTLIVKDEHGNDVFSEQYNAQMLVAAVAKVNGYFYAPDPAVFWKQGYSQDNSFIYVTTQYLTAAMLDSLAKEVDAFESLLICAPAFDVGLNKRYDNISVKKIPQSVLNKCEYGVDNYNLNIVEVPECDEEEWADD